MDDVKQSAWLLNRFNCQRNLCMILYKNSSEGIELNETTSDKRRSRIVSLLQVAIKIIIETGSYKRLLHISYKTLIRMRTLQSTTITPNKIKEAFLGNLPESLAAIGAAISPPMTKASITCQC